MSVKGIYPYPYKTGANLYARDGFAPVLFRFVFTGLPAVRGKIR